jgi:competence protein ComEC
VHWYSLLSLAAYACGVLLAAHSQTHVGWKPAWWLPLAACAALGALAVRTIAGARATRVVALVSLGLVSAAAGSIEGDGALRVALAPPLRDAGRRVLDSGRADATVEGRVAMDAAPADYGAGLLVDVDRIRVEGIWRSTSGRIAVTVSGGLARDRLEAWRRGRRVRMSASLRGPQRYDNPGVPDQTRALALRGITWLASVKSAMLVEVLESGSPVDETAAAIRAHVRRAIGKARLQPIESAILTAILIGDRAGIPPEVTDRLQRAGTFHVMAISGGNIAILTALLVLGFRVCRVPRVPAALLVGLTIGSYGIVAGGTASVSRATEVALLYVAARLFDLRPRNFAVLWAAMLGLLVWSPLTLLDAGFLLTGGATSAILLAGSLIAVRRQREREIAIPVARAPSAIPPDRPRIGKTIWIASKPVGRWMTAVVVATIAAEIALLPIGVTVFSRVSVAGVVLNLAAIPLMTLVQVAGLAMIVLGPIAPPAATAAAALAGVSCEGLVASAGLVDWWPALSWRVPPPPLAMVVVYYAAWGVWVIGRGREHTRLAMAALASAVVATYGLAFAPDWLPARRVLLPPAAEAPRHLTIVFLDVGQGDATFIRFPSGRGWLLDAGGIPGATTFDVGSRVVAPVLWSLGVRALDVMAVSHADPDHAGGVSSIVTDFPPHEVWEGITVEGHGVTSQFHEAARRAGSIVRGRHRGDSREIDRISVDVLNPPRAEWQRVRVRNDDSLVLDLRYSKVRVVLPGDIGADVERALVPVLATDPAATTILKSPHHGSAGSSSPELLDALAPALAVVSAGRGNRFGHPAKATLDRYGVRGIPVLRTDSLGAIALVTDGVTAQAYAWSGDGWRFVWKSI